MRLALAVGAAQQNENFLENGGWEIITNLESLRARAQAIHDGINPFGFVDEYVPLQTYAELRQQIHDDLRVQHPEWIQPDGKAPMCDSYEARLMESLAGLTQRESRQSILDPHRLLEQGAH